jgi:glycosyltransferase involved in cell wall biosynthesis
LTGPRKWLNDYFLRYFEKKYLKEASFVVTSNPFELPKIKRISPDTKFFNVYNGYVESEIALGEGTEQLSDCFRIGYAGTIYPYNRVEDFLEGLKLFISKNPKANFKLLLLGIQSQPEQLNRIKNYDPILKDYIKSTPRLEKKELVQWFCKCNSLLVFTNPKIHLLPSKIYEYLALKRKIIVSINDDSDLKDIMDMTNAGFNCNNSFEIAECIESMYNEFIETGSVSSQVKNFEQFSRKNQAKSFVDIIHAQLN